MNQNLDKIKELENAINSENFWLDKEKAQNILKEYNFLKNNKEDKYDSLVFSIIAGSGGDDSEDFVSILCNMYKKYSTKNSFSFVELDSNPNSIGGYKNITVEIAGGDVYKKLINETGVHRLVRISPFNSKGQRHTSFAFVDVIPKLADLKSIVIDESDLDISFTGAGGPGGQNVNKRDTAVRIVHLPTSVSTRVSSERSQSQNKQKAIDILKSKLHSIMKEKRIQELKDLKKYGDVSISWGNQVRSYVLHPYKLIKDLRTGHEETDVKSVFEGNLDGFIESFNSL